MFQLRSKAVLAAATIFLLAAPTRAQTISSVSTDQATTGMSFDIDGMGFGTKRPKVELLDIKTGKKAKGSSLKVTAYDAPASPSR